MSPTIQKYLGSYSPSIINQAQALLDNGKLAEFLLQRHPSAHTIYNDSELRNYVLAKSCSI